MIKRTLEFSSIFNREEPGRVIKILSMNVDVVQPNELARFFLFFLLLFFSSFFSFS